jgi:hypothetical protein
MGKSSSIVQRIGVEETERDVLFYFPENIRQQQENLSPLPGIKEMLGIPHKKDF